VLVEVPARQPLAEVREVLAEFLPRLALAAADDAAGAN
jgi:hypothetical protein